MTEIIKENPMDFYIKTSLEYYDTHQEKFNKFIKKVAYIKIIDNDNTSDQIYFYDKNKNKILESAYEVMSVYIPQHKIWKWSWSLPLAALKHTFISRKILNYAFGLDTKKDFLLKSILINSKSKIENNLQQDIHIAVSANISKHPYIFKHYTVNIKDVDGLYPYGEVLKMDIDNSIIHYLVLLDFE
jgi:hypothetical protein